MQRTVLLYEGVPSDEGKSEVNPFELSYVLHPPTFLAMVSPLGTTGKQRDVLKPF